MARPPAPNCLQVQGLGPIRNANISFGDLTVLVGPQASGKTLLLETMKLALDYRSVIGALLRDGSDWQGQADKFQSIFYGEGMEDLWGKETKVTWKGKGLDLNKMVGRKTRADIHPVMFYIPAHRALTLRNGWPRHFGDYSPGDPFVVRDFSETLRLLMETVGGDGDAVFPQIERLSDATRNLLKRGVYGNHELMTEIQGTRRRLVLKRGKETSLPFMVWSAGQREFSPLLLGLYHLLPAGKISRRNGLEWVVLEEPEMGLHPRATVAVLFLVMELLARGYKVCLSTHSPQVLDLVWALRVLTAKKAAPEWLLKIFGLNKTPKNLEIASSMAKADIKVHYLDREAEESKDISQLDVDSEDAAELQWGGLTEFASKTSDVVADFVANQPQD
jgi:energy-coupling factor transporter ATP-binding protein EcfA2